MLNLQVYAIAIWTNSYDRNDFDFEKDGVECVIIHLEIIYREFHYIFPRAFYFLLSYAILLIILSKHF